MAVAISLEWSATMASFRKNFEFPDFKNKKCLQKGCCLLTGSSFETLAFDVMKKRGKEDNLEEEKEDEDKQGQ